MVASLFAGCGTDSGTENSASDNSKTEETGQTTSDDPYAAYAGTTISVAAIETGYGSQMWQEVTDAFTEETGIQVELTTDEKIGGCNRTIHAGRRIPGCYSSGHGT